MLGRNVNEYACKKDERVGRKKKYRSGNRYAVGTAKFYELLDKYDVFLLGPQIKFQKSEFQAKAKEKNKPLDVIDFKDYGMMNGEKILDFAMNLKVE